MNLFRKYHQSTMKLAAIMKKKGGDGAYLVKLLEVPLHQNAYVTRDRVLAEMFEGYELITITPEII